VSSDKCKADAARADDNDAAISISMSPNAGDRRIMSINNGAKGMRLLQQLLECTFAAEPGKSDGSMHRAQSLRIQSGFLNRRATGPFHFSKRAVETDPQRGRAGNARAE
jgi:hypothetical protein